MSISEETAESKGVLLLKCEVVPRAACMVMQVMAVKMQIENSPADDLLPPHRCPEVIQQNHDRREIHSHRHRKIERLDQAVAASHLHSIKWQKNEQDEHQEQLKVDSPNDDIRRTVASM